MNNLSAQRRHTKTDVDNGPTVSLIDAVADPAVIDLARILSNEQGTDRKPIDSFATLGAAPIALLSRQDREAARVPARHYPEIASHATTPTHPVYIEGRLGLYATGSLAAGITGSSWPYDYNVRLDALTTNGSVPGSARTGLSAIASGGYVIDDGYWIFSGGHMGGKADYDGSSYNLYNLAEAPERHTKQWGVTLEGDNTLSDKAFHIEAGYRSTSLKDADQQELFASNIDGRAWYQTQWMGLRVRSEGAISVASLDEVQMPFATIAGEILYRSGPFSLQAGVELAAGGNSDEATSTLITPRAGISLIPVPWLNISAGLTGGLHRTTLGGVLDANPWAIASEQFVLRHETEKIGYTTGITIDATPGFRLKVSALRTTYNEYLTFGTVTNGRFDPRYDPVSLDRIEGDLLVDINQQTLLTTRVQWNQADNNRLSAPVAYIPRWFGEAMLSHRMSGFPLTVIVAGNYLGGRIDGSGLDMSDALIVTLEGRYRITQAMEITLAANNLLDNAYELWRGYPERSIYVALGAALRY